MGNRVRCFYFITVCLIFLAFIRLQNTDVKMELLQRLWSFCLRLKTERCTSLNLMFVCCWHLLFISSSMNPPSDEPVQPWIIRKQFSSRQIVPQNVCMTENTPCRATCFYSCHREETFPPRHPDAHGSSLWREGAERPRGPSVQSTCLSAWTLSWQPEENWAEVTPRVCVCVLWNVTAASYVTDMNRKPSAQSNVFLLLLLFTVLQEYSSTWARHHPTVGLWRARDVAVNI